MNKKFVSIDSFETKENIFKITEKYKHKIRVFPIVNKNNELVDFIFDNKIHKEYQYINLTFKEMK